jgi:N-acetylglucosamine kinase-like BadF-type ATPase
MRTILAVDVGKTGCRAALWAQEKDAPLATAEGEGVFGLAAAAGAALTGTAILAVVRPLLEKLGIQNVDAVAVGAPGAQVAPTAAHDLARRLLMSVPGSSVAVASDAVTSHAGALGGDPGVVLAAGTGSVVVAIGPHGQFHHVDGWGPLLGDAGSGAWLGLEGLRAVARAQDGRGPRTSLQALAHDQFGDLEELVLRLSSVENPARTVAAFVPAVARAAEEHDTVATGLVRAAAAELARSVVAGAATLKELAPISVALIGGLLKIGPILLEPLYEELQASSLPLRINSVQGTSLDGARRLAAHEDTLHEPWVVRVGGAASNPSSPGRAE